MTLLQGDTTDLIDSRLWFYLIFAALSVIGGIFGKKKKDEAEAAKRKQQQGRAPQTRPRSPTPQRTPQPPRPARPARPTPPVEARHPRMPTTAHPATRRQPPRPVPARPRPVQARPGPLPERAAVRLPSWEQPDVLTAEVVEEAPAAGQLTTLPSDTLAPVKPARKRPTAEAEQVGRLLRDTSGLRSAFILSEILAPPVALRENRQV